MINWIKNNKLTFAILIFTLILGVFLRLYRAGDYATFLGDEGRDAIIVREMIVNHKWTLLGPTASFGNLYLGPIYYYFMFPALWISNFDPTGPAIMVGIFGTLAIFMVWKVALDFFDKKAAIFASLLFAVSPVAIWHTRSSWNPNPMPFFALLAFYSLFTAIKKNNFKWLFLVGICLGVALQLHYIAMILIGILFLVSFIFIPIKKWKWIVLEIFGFLISLLPQILFEIRHQFVNLHALLDFFLRKGEFKGGTGGVGLDKISPQDIYFRLFSRLVTLDQTLIATILGILCFLVIGYFLLKEIKSKVKNTGLLLFSFWFFLGILVITFYRGQIHDHYLGFLFPTPFLALGFVFSKLSNNKILKYPVILIFLLLFAVNLNKINLFAAVNGPNYQIKRAKIISDTIANDVGKEKFNIAIYSATKDFMGFNYRYFLKVAGKEPEDYGNFDKIDTLYLIEEVRESRPEELGLWELGTFGKYKVTNSWPFDFQVKIYKLEHE